MQLPCTCSTTKSILFTQKSQTLKSLSIENANLLIYFFFLLSKNLLLVCSSDSSD